MTLHGTTECLGEIKVDPPVAQVDGFGNNLVVTDPAGKANRDRVVLPVLGQLPDRRCDLPRRQGRSGRELSRFGFAGDRNLTLFPPMSMTRLSSTVAQPRRVPDSVRPEDLRNKGSLSPLNARRGSSSYRPAKSLLSAQVLALRSQGRIEMLNPKATATWNSTN